MSEKALIGGPAPTVSRRSVLQALALTGVAALAGSFSLSGCQRVVAPAFKLRSLSAREFRTLERVADCLMPGGSGAPPASACEVARQADAFLAGLNPHTQDDLHLLLKVFDGMPLLAGKWSPILAQDRVGAGEFLAGWERGRLPFMRQGFNGLKRLLVATYFADPRSWDAIGYEGVWVGKRDLGYGVDNSGWGDLVNPNVYAKFTP